jgi:hypothetical protein
LIFDLTVNFLARAVDGPHFYFVLYVADQFASEQKCPDGEQRLEVAS